MVINCVYYTTISAFSAVSGPILQSANGNMCISWTDIVYSMSYLAKIAH